MDCRIIAADLVPKKMFKYFAMFVRATWKETCRFRHASHKYILIGSLVCTRNSTKIKISISSRSHSAPPSLGNSWPEAPTEHFSLNVDTRFDKVKGHFSDSVLITDHEGLV